MDDFSGFKTLCRMPFKNERQSREYVSYPSDFSFAFCSSPWMVFYVAFQEAGYVLLNTVGCTLSAVSIEKQKGGVD